MVRALAVAAIYYASLMEHRLGEPGVRDVAGLVVCASVVAHGLTFVPLTRLLRVDDREAERSRRVVGPDSHRRFRGPDGAALVDSPTRRPGCLITNSRGGASGDLACSAECDLERDP